MPDTPTSPTKKESSDSSTLMPATETMRKKADFVKKCFLSLLKLLRCLKCTKPSKKKEASV
jgi:hypothetical protein